GDSPTQADPSAHHPAAADESEQARTTGRQGLPGGARQEPGDRAPSEASTGAKKDSKERLRLKPEELIAPSRNAASGAEEGEETDVAEVIAFANQKGGVAKTTTTLNLAVAFSESGHRVLCIDLEPQGNLTMSKDIDPE